MIVLKISPNKFTQSKECNLNQKKRNKKGGLIFMNINNLGLLNMLAAVINESEESSDKAIADYLLRNLDSIDNLTINEIVDKTFVSHSSVRRFSNRLGYQNFSELKSTFSDIVFPSNMHLRTFEPVEKYKQIINKELDIMIKGINKVIDDETVRYIVNQIYTYDEVIFVSSNNISSDLLKFQQELFYGNKIIRVITNNFDNYLLKEISDSPKLIIVASISGVFAEEVSHIMNVIEGEKILITVNQSEGLSYPYNHTIYMSEKDMKSDPLGLFGKYGITYLLDLISEEYVYNNKIL